MTPRFHHTDDAPQKQKRQIPPRPLLYETDEELSQRLDKMYGPGNWAVRGCHVCYRHKGADDNPMNWSSYYEVVKRGEWYFMYDPHNVD